MRSGRRAGRPRPFDYPLFRACKISYLTWLNSSTGQTRSLRLVPMSVPPTKIEIFGLRVPSRLPIWLKKSRTAPLLVQIWDVCGISDAYLLRLHFEEVLSRPGEAEYLKNCR